MWKAAQIAQKKRVEVAAKAGGGAQGAFAASAMAMFKDGEEQPGAEGVVSQAMYVLPVIAQEGEQHPLSSDVLTCSV